MTSYTIRIFTIRTAKNATDFACYATVRQSGELLHETSMFRSASAAQEVAQRWAENNAAASN
jgi:hypothetical protein